MIHTCKTLEPTEEDISAINNTVQYREEARIVAKNVINNAMDILCSGNVANYREALECAMMNRSNWLRYEFLI